MKTIALHTLGCKLNFAETSTIGNDFVENGFKIVDFNSRADIYVINTCTVTESADKECRQIVRRALRNNPNGFVVVTGCYAQLKPEELSKIQGVDLILGTNEKFHILNFIDSLEKKDFACVFTTPTEELNDFGPAYSHLSDDRTRAFLKVQDGCDYKCSFCTIPLARGFSRSLSEEIVIDEFKNLLQLGYKEIVLTGVNVGDYGVKIGTNLYELLKKLSNVEGDFRIRISSIEPNLITDEIIDLIADNPKFCDHFHIPLQSGSDKILSLMQRRYKKKLYEEVVYKIKNRIPNCGIGADVIVGFPNESEADYSETYEFINSLPVSYLHVFTYSERQNTKAIEIKDRIPYSERKQRTNTLRMLGAKKKYAFYSSMKNSCSKVLFEHKEKDGMVRGFTSNYVRVLHPCEQKIENKFVDFEIKNIFNEYCTGNIIQIFN
ncbi:MAG: tRNA (N(6)-L-threonylcarbamoyladenosine(37)-C(2))-methylthiotransferase MtaB [Ignavibacteria bacterium]|nr:tRNA (N(6)-L-threonylcarbamoyladenosine(37)-C(2))-methylthiotransferase MtaB [Ignavibacteria bacterium]